MLARIIFFALCLASFTATAQNSWSLTNISNQKLTFETFDPARGTWREQIIYPNQRTNYNLSYGNTAGKFHIATQNRGFVEYKVRAGSDYTLGWDNNKGVWDLKFAASPAPQENRPPPISAAAYHLRNSSNQTLSFETLDPARGTWKRQSAFPNETKSFTFAEGNRVGKIRIVTEGRGFVEYDVRAGWKYDLLWDRHKGVWDFRTLHRE